VGAGTTRKSTRFKLLTLILALGLALLALAPTAQASRWRVDTFPELGSTGLFLSVDCPSETLCVAAGSDDAIASSTEPAAGVGHWRFGHLTEPGAYGEVPAPPGSVPFLPGAQIRGVSCPSTGLCVAVTRLGSIFTARDPAGGAGAWSGFQLQAPGVPRSHLYGISCPTTGLCVAVGLGGKILTSADPGGGPTAWTTTQLPADLELHGVSCSSPTQCLVVGAEGVVLSSSDPTGGPAAWQVLHEPAFGELMGVRCTGSTFCLTGNLGSILTSIRPSADPAAFVSTPAPAPLQLTAFDCVDEQACAAVNNNADVITSTDPTGGAGKWSMTNVVPYNEPNGTFGVSCPSTQLCVAVGTHYLIAASTDPFGDAPGTTGASDLRRPTVQITAHPRRVIRTRKARIRVSFRFREIGLRAGFLCKLGAKPFRPCRSPRRYRVGPGRHVFAVKVADPGGPDQTATRFRFRVIRLHPQHRHR